MSTTAATILPLRVLQCGRHRLSLERPLIMGVVNVTPDSFSDGGRFSDAERAVAHAWALIDEGADILDIGGESTRPGAEPVAPEEEARRVLPVLEALAGGPVPISVDTRTPALMSAAIAAGAGMINDISALEASGALAIVAPSDVAVCLMHKQGDPRTMQDHPVYGDVVREVTEYLERRIEAAVAAGIGRDRIVVDPGFGFGKTLAHNLELLRALERVASLGVPVLAGLSRKGMLGRLTGRSVDNRVHASVAAALIAVEKGARIVRVHDVAATRDALQVWQAVASA
ncbi:MAG TPA: dihydropteroate synthase [Burkholderiales bacterium]|nr:dihydropteroate synthase [Burkholderiales bacterium]